MKIVVIDSRNGTHTLVGRRAGRGGAGVAGGAGGRSRGSGSGIGEGLL